MKALAPSLVAAATLLAACATASGPAEITPPARLAPCPAAPHCVGSLETDEGHRVPPLVLAQPAAQAWPAIVAAVRGNERTTVVQADSRYLHAEVISPWHFYTDDLELMLGEDGRVDVRSASRIGYYDFKVNRKRVDALRAQLATLGLVRSASQ